MNVLEEGLALLSKRLEIALDDNLITEVVFDGIGVDKKNERLISKWKIFGDSYLIMEIDKDKIAYGFHLEINSNKFNHNFDSSLRPISKRYFSNFEISKSAIDGMVVKSKYVVGSRQLNSRDFLDYTIYIYQMALQLTNEVFRINKLGSLKIAV